MKTLAETVELMISDDQKDRLKAEYWQTKIRYDKLHDIIIKANAGTLDFDLTYDIAILTGQASAMSEYLFFLESRAILEGVNLKSGLWV